MNGATVRDVRNFYIDATALRTAEPQRSWTCARCGASVRVRQADDSERWLRAAARAHARAAHGDRPLLSPDTAPEPGSV